MVVDDTANAEQEDGVRVNNGERKGCSGVVASSSSAKKQQSDDEGAMIDLLYDDDDDDDDASKMVKINRIVMGHRDYALPPICSEKFNFPSIHNPRFLSDTEEWMRTSIEERDLKSLKKAVEAAQRLGMHDHHNPELFREAQRALRDAEKEALHLITNKSALLSLRLSSKARTKQFAV